MLALVLMLVSVNVDIISVSVNTSIYVVVFLATHIPYHLFPHRMNAIVQLLYS